MKAGFRSDSGRRRAKLPMSLKSWRARQKVQLEALVCGDNCKDDIAVVGANALALGGDLMPAKMNDEMALQALRQTMQHLESVVQGTALPEEVSARDHSAACMLDAISKKRILATASSNARLRQKLHPQHVSNSKACKFGPLSHCTNSWQSRRRYRRMIWLVLISWP